MGKYYPNDSLKYRYREYDEIRALVESYVPPLKEYQTILGHTEASGDIIEEGSEKTRALPFL